MSRYSRRTHRGPWGFAAALAVACLTGTAPGQDLEPRAYSPAPLGTHFAVLGLGYSTGDVLLDPSVPITDVKADLGLGALGYAQTFKLAKRSASLTVTLPYVFGTVSGQIEEEFAETTRSGFGDGSARVAVNLIGGPALTRQEFARRKRVATLGASLLVKVPTGEYDPARLINIGMNRWSFKPELGLSVPAGKFDLDLYVGVWLFTDNPDFYGGQRRSQAPLLTTQAHASYTFRPGLWLAADATFYAGGRTTLDGIEMDDRQENSRGGITLAVPFAKAYSLKFSCSTGVSTRIGGKFTTFAMAVQYRWFSR